MFIHGAKLAFISFSIFIKFFKSFLYICKNNIFMSLFQFDYVELLPSEQIGQHSQATWEIVLVLKGSGMRSIDDVSKTIRPGELILIPPHTNHCWHFKGDNPIANVAITFPPPH